MLFEGAQGALLDIDHGTYPFVTSSNPVAGAACVGAGVGPTRHRPRSGASPRPTPRASAPARSRPSSTTRLGERDLRQRGGEFGTTTGRPRRTGWLDLVALRYAARINGLTALAITKLDVLSGFETLKVCTSYRSPDGASFDDLPLPPERAAPRAIGEYTELPGWTEDITERAQRGGAARGTRASTCASSRTSSGCRS